MAGKMAGSVALALLFLAVFPADALAAGSTLECQGPVPVGTLYDTTNYCTGITGIQNIFSGLICNFKTIIDDVLTRMYCGVQDTMRTPLALAITLYLVVFGIQISSGMIRMNGGEIVSRLIKIGLIWIFATQAAYGIGVGYNFFISAMDTGIGWALGSILTAPTSFSFNDLCQFGTMTPPFTNEKMLFLYLDYRVCTTLTGPFSESGARLTAFIGALSYVAPPVFLMFMYFTLKTLAIIVRAVLSYLLCISAIAFLIALSPIFLSFMLFKTTSAQSENWLRYLIAFTFQIVLNFAGIALWLMVVGELLVFFDELASMIIPIKNIATGGPVRTAIDSYGLCRHSLEIIGYAPRLVCDYTLDPVLPSAIPNSSLFLYVVVYKLTMLCIVAYAFDALLQQLPSLARQITGPAYGVKLSSGGLGGVNFPGLSYLEKMRRPVGGGILRGGGLNIGRLFGRMPGEPMAPNAPVQRRDLPRQLLGG